MDAIVTTLGGTPFDVTVYKVGDKYVAARSNEFGYANYEVEESKPWPGWRERADVGGGVDTRCQRQVTLRPVR